MGRPIFKTPKSWGGGDNVKMTPDPKIDPETGNIRNPGGRQEDDIDADQGFAGKLPRS